MADEIQQDLKYNKEFKGEEIDIDLFMHGWSD